MVINRRKNGNGKSNGHRITGVYKAYNFTSKDPVCDQLLAIAEKHFGRRVTYAEMAQITEAGGPSISAMRGWWVGKTKRPTNAATEAAGRAMGMQRKWVRLRSNEPE